MNHDGNYKSNQSFDHLLLHSNGGPRVSRHRSQIDVGTRLSAMFTPLSNSQQVKFLGIGLSMCVYNAMACIQWSPSSNSLFVNQQFSEV